MPEEKKILTFSFSRYAMMCLRRVPRMFIFAPGFTTHMVIRRILFTFTRRFCGPVIRSPITGEPIYNIQSLNNAFAMQIAGELDGPWKKHIQETIFPIVYDIGSNMGQFRAYVLSINSRAVIFTFDCWPEMAEFVPKDSHVNAALGSSSGGFATLTKGGDEGWSATTEPGVYTGKIISRVPVQKLDEIWLARGGKSIDLLKIDVDGAEIEVLKGATESLKKTRFVLIETADFEQISQLCPNRKWTTVNGTDFTGELMQ
jgi:FkbM family methyltransferase